MRHEVAGSAELVGPDVVLVHRLLKNSVVERTGAHGYSLLTDSSIARTGLDPATLGLVRHVETYDDVGDVGGWVRDLEARWREEDARKAVLVAPGEADVELERELPATPASVWNELTDPRAQLSWRLAATRIDSDAPPGGRGTGAVTHCVHGKQAFDQEILDWKPFSHYSYREAGPAGTMLWSFELDPSGPDSTHLSVRVAFTGGRVQRLAGPLIRRKIAQAFADNLDALVAELRERRD